MELDSAEDSEASASEEGSPGSPSSLSFFRPSPFPYIPPTVRFGVPKRDKIKRPRGSVQKMLRWCENSLIPRVVRKCILASHFHIVPESSLWMGYWGKHYRSSSYSQVQPYQKINHFPGTFYLGRKDRLWASIRGAGDRFGWAEWTLMPATICLPRDAKALRLAAAEEPNRALILKPPASARGAGIRLVHKWSQVPKKTPLVVQDYLTQPFLINGSKFDLRIYVYVTAFNPLRIYLYEDGLVRFAALKYSSSSTTFSNRFIHLTNSSVSKHADKGAPNSSTAGSKWSVKTLWRYLSEEGHDTRPIMQRIVDLVIKTFVCSEGSVNQFINQTLRYPFACHELFGLDILLDKDLKPWLLEVNISPSLQCSTPVDEEVKLGMTADVLNLAGFQVPSKAQMAGRLDGGGGDAGNAWERLQLRVKPCEAFLTAAEAGKAALAVEEFERSSGRSLADWILDDLSGAELRVLLEAEGEMERSGGFTRIFPGPRSAFYLGYMRKPRYANILLAAWTRRYSGQRRQEGIQILADAAAAQRHIYQGSFHNLPQPS